MAKHHTLHLTEAEIQALVELRDKGEPAYLRERATAMLKIHQGVSPHEVARRGLLKKRDPDTVYAWLGRYREHGLRGLFHTPGRGRKSAFSPSRLKWPNQNCYKLSVRIRGKSTRIKPAGRYVRSVRSCLGCGMSLCRVFTKSSHEWVSAISVPETMCGVLTEIMLKNFLASSAL